MKLRDVKTFAQLYEYIQNADRDEYGVHIVNESCALHIYNGKQQVNICIKTINGWDPKQAIIFLDSDSVKVIPVINGITQYERYRKYSMNGETRRLFPFWK